MYYLKCGIINLAFITIQLSCEGTKKKGINIYQVHTMFDTKLVHLVLITSL